MTAQTPRLDPQLESSDTALLVPELLEKLELLIKACTKDGLSVRAGCTVRGPLQQAKLWCRSRTREEVLQRQHAIIKRAPILAGMLQTDFAGLGPQVTTSLPGQSWHQWGEAIDIYTLVGGKAVWDGSISKKVALLAQRSGLFHSWNIRDWAPRRRHWHIQLRAERSPLFLRGFMDSWADVEREMVSRFDI